MTHLTMDQLLQAREPSSDPGAAAIFAHLDACPACRQELDRLNQRVARMKALPPLRPPRDRWPAVRARLAREQKGLRIRQAVLAGLAVAASVALAVAVAPAAGNAPDPTQAAISTAQAQSATLENAIRRYEPENRVVDGHTARLADELQGRIAALDRRLEAAQLEAAQLEDGTNQDAQLLQLWRERVGLLDALVDVHVTRASNVGL